MEIFMILLKDLFEYLIKKGYKLLPKYLMKNVT